MKELSHILKLLNPWKWNFISSSLLLVMGIFIRMIEPKIFQVAIDYVAPLFNSLKVSQLKKDFATDAIVSLLPKVENNTAITLLLWLAVIYILVSIFRAVFIFIAKTINADATEKAVKAMRNNLFTHIQQLPMDYFPTISTGELIQRSTGDIETIRRFIGNQTVEVLRLLAIFVFSSYWLFAGNLIFGFISIAVVPLIGISGFIFFKKEQKVWQHHEDEADKLNAITQENLSGIRVVQAFAQENSEIEKFEKQNIKKLKVALNHAKLHTIFWPLSDLLVHLQIVVSIMVGGYMAINQTISLGELVSFYTYIVMVAWPLRQVGRLLSEMGMALVATERIEQILSAEKEKDHATIFNLEDKLSKIEFRNVWFRYSKKDEFLLQDINFTIKKGESVAILGPTGAGKSSLVKLLLRFYEPEKGEILINDIPIQKISKKILRKRIGLTLQQAFLFTQSVGQNISYASSKGATQRSVEEVANWAGLDEVENIFEEGYDTLVGEKGVTLSGGQKQRVSIARTFLQDPDILILDDVTSAVDTVTEGRIMKNVQAEMAKKTTLVITHRLTSVPYVDSILILQDGKITAKGKHKDLKETNQFYKEIHQIQNMIETEIDSI